MKIFQAISNLIPVMCFYEKTQIKLNYLIAFDKVKRQTAKLMGDCREMIDSLYLESGGYASRIGRANINLDQYLTYLQQYEYLFDRVTSFDDKHNDFEHNFRNLMYLHRNLRDVGSRLMPVLHEPENYFQKIQYLSEHGYNHIAIGTPKKIEDAVFERTKRDLPQIKLHLLGKLDRKILIKHRPDSADAASWIRAAGYGIVHYWHPQEETEYRIYVGHKKQPTGTILKLSEFRHRGQFLELAASIFKYGEKDIIDSTEVRSMLNLYFYKQLEDYINRLAAASENQAAHLEVGA